MNSLLIAIIHSILVITHGNQFCDIAYKNSLLAMGGLFTTDEHIFATRHYPNTNGTIVWRFKLKSVDNRMTITDMSSHNMRDLFREFEYFVSGFTIQLDSTSNKTETSRPSQPLTVILGPKQGEDYSRQHYRVYRFNGNSFDNNIDHQVIPLGLGTTGTTNRWFTPTALITGTYRSERRQIIAFNHNDKSINRLNVRELSAGVGADHQQHRAIGNRYWERLVPYVPFDSYYYHLIDLKLSPNASQKQTLVVTEQMAYELLDNNTLREVMHPWKLFGCQSLGPGVMLRSLNGGKDSDTGAIYMLGVKLSNGTAVTLETYDNIDRQLTVQFIVGNILYISIYSGILYYIYTNSV